MIEIRNINKSYNGIKVIDQLSLSIPKGTRVALTAPSGCGKTTLLHIIAGLTKADSGDIRGIASSDICMLFQEVRLFERFTALENVMAVLKDNRKERKERALEWLLKVELTKEDAQKLPSALSGGQQQRVALARALAAQCPVVLLDEPFKGLDSETKKQIYRLADGFLADKTLILVTHDPEDAEALGCEVLTFTEGMKLVK